MEPNTQRKRLAFVSFAVLLGGWAFLAVLMIARLNLLYPAAWWIRAAVFCCWIFSPVAFLLALGGLIFDPRKFLPLVATLASLCSAVLVYFISP